MIDGALRAIALAASAVVVLSFALFAVEEVREASGRQVDVVAPSREAERSRAADHTPAREVIDDVNDVLLAPFAGAAGDTDSSWASRGIPALIGLLVYGLGLAYLARLVATREHTLVRHQPPAPPTSAGSKPPPGPA